MLGEGAETGKATTVETKTQNPLTHLTGAETMPSKPVHRNITKELPREVSIDVGAHGAEGGEHGRDRRGPDRRAWRGFEKEGDTKTDLIQRKQKPEEENDCDEGQYGPGWKGGGQQNQAGRRNRSGKNGQRESAGGGGTETQGLGTDAGVKEGAESGGSETRTGAEISRS